jgi:hypothetical protein
LSKDLQPDQDQKYHWTMIGASIAQGIHAYRKSTDQEQQFETNQI